MAVRKFSVLVSQVVEVTIDDSKLDEAFMAEFRASHYQFDTVEQHAEHIAQLAARGLIDMGPNPFVEGYGPLVEVGVEYGCRNANTELLGDL
ncbi:hypothetical protein [Caulobacter sp. Root343]|uniref:hypothetical protein n=1 Tax=Caulobacter sp. Root343 TaxID=1736520 RepID=UPI0007006683|nr:hypothetical protein [Caulobacter sp. Root343]KQV66599.1 hypothetical protein ASC70_12255 [Caulobacter sp. Root343]